MITVHTIHELKGFLSKERAANKQIGLVPTMGALHLGHISLVEYCVAENDVTVASIFVNPTQFNDKKDLDTYPRTLKEDSKMLEEAGCTYLFAPSTEEIYPEPDTRVFDFGYISTVMEGAKRPGHFNGVAQVVSKLFQIVNPTNAYFGEKDFQQIAIVNAMNKALKLETNIISCPTVREPDGLAMSSRNVRLSEDLRQKAPVIAKTLKNSLDFTHKKSVKETIDFVTDTINSVEGMTVEYFEIVDAETLRPITHWDDSSHPIGCITVYCGDVRLLDNIRYSKTFL